MKRTTVGKRGTIYLSKEIRKESRIDEGSQVDLVVEDDGMVLIKRVDRKKRLKGAWKDDERALVGLELARKEMTSWKI